MPSLYESWIREVFARGIPRESRADCSNCPQVRANHTCNSPTQNGFSAETKCCTYLPELSNFAVGGILNEGGHGAVSVMQRMELSPGSVTPLGLLRTELYQTIYSLAGERAFGRAPLLRCPHYLDEGSGSCGIWRHRNHVCFTWFCLHERSLLGRAFWFALKELFREVERQLSAWCAQQLLGVAWFQSDIIRQSRGASVGLADELSGHNPWPEESRTWKEWNNKKADYFIDCARLVSTLRWEAIIDLIGMVGRSRLEVVKIEYDRMLSGTVPANLVQGTLGRAQITEAATVCIGSMGTYEVVELSVAAIESLARFDGRPTEDVLAELPRPVRDELTPSILLRLLEVGALVGRSE